MHSNAAKNPDHFIALLTLAFVLEIFLCDPFNMESHYFSRGKSFFNYSFAWGMEIYIKLNRDRLTWYDLAFGGIVGRRSVKEILDFPEIKTLKQCALTLLENSDFGCFWWPKDISHFSTLLDTGKLNSSFQVEWPSFSSLQRAHIIEMTCNDFWFLTCRRRSFP